MQTAWCFTETNLFVDGKIDVAFAFAARFLSRNFKRDQTIIAHFACGNGNTATFFAQFMGRTEAIRNFLRVFPKIDGAKKVLLMREEDILAVVG